MENHYLSAFLSRMLDDRVAGKVLRALAEIEIVQVNAAECIKLNQGLQEHFGGIHALRSLPLLESALAAPMQQAAYGGEEVTIQSLGDILMERMIKNHPFADGNKRTAILAMLLFHEKNGLPVTSLDQDELYRRAIRIASERERAIAVPQGKPLPRPT